MAATCVHGMPTPAACFECMEEGVFVPGQFPDTDVHSSTYGDVDPDEIVVTHTFKAGRGGRCVLCPTEIAIGEPIAALDTEPVSYAHESCVPRGAEVASWAGGGGGDA